MNLKSKIRWKQILADENRHILNGASYEPCDTANPPPKSYHFADRSENVENVVVVKSFCCLFSKILQKFEHLKLKSKCI